MKNSFNIIKESYNKYKEMKKDPRKKAGLKLLGYLIFFIVLILLSIISNGLNKNSVFTNNTTTTTSKVIVDKYVEKQNKLMEDKYFINYEITHNNINYKINGTIENNIVDGYLESIDVIKKIVIKNNNIFVIENGIESNLEVLFEVNYLNIENLINLVKQNSAFIQEKEDVKIYLYEIENKKIYITSGKEDIITIKIEDDLNVYILNFDK